MPNTRIKKYRNNNRHKTIWFGKNKIKVYPSLHDPSSVFEAIQLTDIPIDSEDMDSHWGAGFIKRRAIDHGRIIIDTSFGTLTAVDGDYIIREGKKSYGVFNQETFKDLFEEVTSDENHNS